MKKRKENHIDNVVFLDIETTTVFNVDGEFKTYNEKENIEWEKYESFGFCYIWTIAIDDDIYHGRDLEDLKKFIFDMNKNAKGKKITIYVHNLSYEFQFLRNIFDMDVFAREQRKVICAKIKDTNVEFRCSMMLSGMKLEDVGKYFCKSQKMVGDLDYSKMRTPTTELTEKEMNYIDNDVRVGVEYIRFMLSLYDNDFSKIPLTMTGIIRKELKKYISENYRDEKYKSISFKWWCERISGMINDAETFCDLVRCFRGGEVEANFAEVNKIKTNVHHNDFDSSYIATLLSEKFACKQFRKCDVNEKMDLENFQYIVKCKFENITSKKFFNFIPYEKCCKNINGFIIENGRVVHADELTMTMCDVDFLTVKEFYDFDKCEILMMKKAKKEYLPKVLCEFIIKKYIEKYELKQQKKAGFDVEKQYQMTKQQLCSIYGMMITNSIRDDVEYDGEWKCEKNDERTEIDEDEEFQKIRIHILEQRKHNTEFLSYPWGVWVSAYARRNLMKIIEIVDEDGLYCDTDSLFYTNDFGEYGHFIEQYNNEITEKIKKMCEVNGIEWDERLCNLGHFESESDCDEFKTLGAKRYITKINGKIEITVSGVNKELGNVFKNLDEFRVGFVFNRNVSGKNVLIYKNNQPEIKINGETINQKFGISMFPTTYKIENSNKLVKLSTESAFATVPHSQYLMNL